MRFALPCDSGGRPVEQSFYTRRACSRLRGLMLDVQIPSLSEYKASGASTLIGHLHADVETPLSAYWKLAHNEVESFLLESVTGGEQVSRYSFLGVRPRCVLRIKGRQVTGAISTKHLAEGGDPLDALKAELGPSTIGGGQRFPGGAVGMLGYDLVRYFEKLGDGPADELQIDDLAMLLTNAVVEFDHARNTISAIALCDGTEVGYSAAAAELERIAQALEGPLPPLPSASSTTHRVSCNMTQLQFESKVSRVREYIAAGDAIQVVPSLRFSTKVEAHPVSIYRALRTINPSPYMFLMRFGDFDLVGASPELLSSLHGRTARVRPIAGTRKRGDNPTEDARLAEDLLADEKERAEHIMLVDLGRNDLGRVCEIGSINVNELMQIERYSHVLHIVSDVSGNLASGKDAFDLVRASFPAGTVSGAPKVRAMQIIDGLEPTRRGAYAGAMGYFSNTGDMDLCLGIRTILIKDGVAHVQAGAGIVHDSVPAKEYEECCNKAMAALKAIEMAQKGVSRPGDASSNPVRALL